MASKNPIHRISNKATLLDAVRLFGSSRARRLLVVDANDRPTNVLSQSTITAYVAKHISVLGITIEINIVTSIGNIPKTSLKESGLGLTKVITVETRAIALEAFKIMADQQITGVAVVEEDGTLVSIISAKDIKVVPSKLLV